jgi:hypothetical protein
VTGRRACQGCSYGKAICDAEGCGWTGVLAYGTHIVGPIPDDAGGSTDDGEVRLVGTSRGARYGRNCRPEDAARDDTKCQPELDITWAREHVHGEHWLDSPCSALPCFNRASVGGDGLQLAVVAPPFAFEVVLHLCSGALVVAAGALASRGGDGLRLAVIAAPFRGEVVLGPWSRWGACASWCGIGLIRRTARGRLGGAWPATGVPGDYNDLSPPAGLLLLDSMPPLARFGNQMISHY